MKRFNLILLTVLFTTLPILQSCNNNDGYSIGDLGRDWVTVNVNDDDNYTFTGDNWGTMLPIASSVPWYKPKEGQRAVVYFNPLYDDYQGYDVAIKIEAIRNILTKSVGELTDKNEEEIGNDPVYIYKDGGMWVNGGYLNIVFRYDIPVNGNKHLVNLVKNTTVTPEDDGYIHLEYRHNTHDDVSGNGYRWEGAVSFDLSSLDITPQTKGIKVKINSTANGDVVVTLDLNSKAPTSLMNINYASITDDLR